MFLVLCHQYSFYINNLPLKKLNSKLKFFTYRILRFEKYNVQNIIYALLTVVTMVCKALNNNNLHNILQPNKF